MSRRMAAFSVPLSSLCVSTMTSMVLAPSTGPADAVVSVPPQIPDQALSPDVPPSFLSGFRVEGAPELEVVFGDSESYKQHVDRFFALDEAMDRTRSSFQKNVQAAQAALGRARKSKRCPVDQVARAYYGARRDGESYRALGSELESEHGLITQLDDMGETAALTPDYRWKVKQVTGRYRRALIDLKEMRVAFLVQLGSELRHKGCRGADLVKRAGELVASGAPPDDESEPELPVIPPRVKPGEEPKPVVPATTVTFYVDNRACPGAQSVFLDGALLGEVPARSRSAFQALAGHHALCLIGKGSNARCGDPGTLRSAFLHDGWSIGLHCAK
jgi:hypothetical protein